MLDKIMKGADASIDIGIKLTKAVYSLNRRRVYHRDIKPENIMLLKDGGLKLLDLGVARLPGIQDDADQGARGGSGARRGKAPGGYIPWPYYRRERYHVYH